MKNLNQAVSKTVMPDGREIPHVYGMIPKRRHTKGMNFWFARIHLMVNGGRLS